MKQRSAILVAVFALAFVTTSRASPLFEEDAVMQISLSGPLTTLLADDADTTEQPFVLSAAGFDHAIKVRARGKSRRRVCNFPPLRLNFSSDTSNESPFRGQDKLKLVTHCRGGKSADSNVLEEYAAYRIFNLLSDVGYRVRLARIVYSDTEKNPEDEFETHYGFMIESESELAERTNATPLDIPAVSLSSLNERQAALVYVFQYLIGNTDWSLVTGDGDTSCCHNGDLFEIDSRIFYVPFDFDLSGLVNARYAKPDPSLRIKSVTRRLYRGYCLSSNSLPEAIELITSQEDAILSIPGGLPGLPQKDAEDAQDYLGQFFKRATDRAKLVRDFERRCL